MSRRRAVPRADDSWNANAQAFGYSHVVVWRAVVALRLRDWLRARRGHVG